ncbi:HNH endonuclease signature motif containing protein [Streptomyces sp. NPDC050804]|uniref:HNH endonuclease n=1 Tax=Streptomyces sp. NPDC050804 TaxID=3154745 RepID=UPI00341386AC
MCRRVLERERAGLHEERRQHTGERRVRDGEARQAVLLRCKERCENPECFKQDLPYRTPAGKALLQVDHIDDHAAGGRDHPSAMIALCPNCHANKTYGADREAVTAALRGEALRLHEALWESTNKSW